MPRTTAPETWGHSTVRTACPLDCPDSCTLDVTVEKGRIVKIDGGDANPVTRNYICAKVRRFAERVYGEDRLLYPAIRKGDKGQGTFTRVTGTKRSTTSPRACSRSASSTPAEAILPFCYGGSNGLLTQDTNDAGAVPRLRHVAPRAHRLRGADRRRQPGALRQDAGRHLPGLRHAKLIVLWGVNPAASGIHLVPFLKEARAAGREAGRHRSPRDLARAAGRSAPRAAARAPTCRSRSRSTVTCSRAGTPTRRSSPQHTTGAEQLARARRASGRSSAPPKSPASTPAAIRQLAPRCTSRRARRWCAAAGGSSATATAAAPRPRSWRCRRSAASSASAAAGSR